MSNKGNFIMNWMGYEIEITHSPNAYPAYERIYGHSMNHIELETLSPPRAPLPITETGYKSIYITEPNLNEEGGVEALVLAMLDDALKSREWIEMEFKRRQLPLF